MDKMPTNAEMLDWLDNQTGGYTGRVIFRFSGTGRGWRLHESSKPNAQLTVREAIADAMSIYHE